MYLLISLSIPCQFKKPKNFVLDAEIKPKRLHVPRCGTSGIWENLHETRTFWLYVLTLVTFFMFIRANLLIKPKHSPSLFLPNNFVSEKKKFSFSKNWYPLKIV